MPSFENNSAGETGGFSLDRRTVLKSAAVAAAGTGLLTGTASASTFQFFGCSQVCAGTDHDYAVIWTDDGLRTVEFDDRSDQVSDRKNIDWHSEPMCVEVEAGEAVIGVLKHDANGTVTCKFCPNPNQCARNYYDSVSDVLDELEELDDFGCDEFVEADECRTHDSSHGREQRGRNR